MRFKSGQRQQHYLIWAPAKVKRLTHILGAPDNRPIMVRGRRPKSAITVDVNFEQTFNTAHDLFKTVKGVIKHYQKIADTENFTHLRIKEYLDHGSSGVVIKCTSPHQNDEACVIKMPLDTKPHSANRVKEDIVLWKQYPMLMNNDYLVSPITQDTFLPEGIYRMPCWDTSLLKVTRKNPFFDAKQLINVVTAMCQGCQALHSLSPPHIHRDIKPANILVKVNPSHKKVTKAAIADFGSVHCISQVSKDLNMGTTFGYRAPEIAWNFNTGITSDLWSIAVVVLELILGYSLLVTNSKDESDYIRAENKLFFSLLNKTEDDIIYMLGQSTSSTNKTGTDALRRLMEQKHFPSITIWDRILAYNAWDPALVAVLKRCFQLNPSKRYASVQEFEVAFCNVVRFTYVQDATPLQCPHTVCNWATIHAQHPKIEHIHTWFIAILWTNNPANSAFIREWFASGLTTDRAYRFQKIALKLWNGDPQWIHDLNQCIQGNRPHSPEEFFSEHMKLPKPLIQDTSTNTWKVADITQERSHANLKTKLYFDTVDNNADVQIGIMTIQNLSGQTKQVWDLVRCKSHPDLPLGSTHLNSFQRKVFIHHMPLKPHAAIAQ